MSDQVRAVLIDTIEGTLGNETFMTCAGLGMAIACGVVVVREGWRMIQHYASHGNHGWK